MVFRLFILLYTQETCAPYWDDNELKGIGEYTSQVVSVKQEIEFIMRTIKIGKIESDVSRYILILIIL